MSVGSSGALSGSFSGSVVLWDGLSAAFIEIVFIGNLSHSSGLEL